MEDITEALWGSKASPTTISELNKKAYVNIAKWHNLPLRGGKHSCVHVDSICTHQSVEQTGAMVDKDSDCLEFALHIVIDE